MATPQFFSGFGGTASVGTPAVELPIRQWSFIVFAETIVFKNSRSGPTPIRESTYLDCTDLTIDIDYDFANNPFIAASPLSPRTMLGNVRLYLHQSADGNLDGPYWLFAQVVVKSAGQTLVRDGKIATRIICEASGAITPPQT